MSTDKEQRILNVMFAKSGSGGITSRLSVPISWLKDMNITPDDRQIVLVKEGNEIIIKKLEEN